MTAIKAEPTDCWLEQRAVSTSHCPSFSATSRIVPQEEDPLYVLGLDHSSPPPPSPSPQPTPRVPHPQPQPTIRAQYRPTSTYVPVELQYRILSGLKQQKSLKSKGESTRRRGVACNETKNIAKNYGKAIIAFIMKNKKLFRAICKQTSTPYQRINEELPELKAILTTVVGFRRVWSHYKYSQCMRVISHIFLRRCALGYVFNSKVSNIQTHIKYRNKFLEALKNPATFDHIKDY